jgi:hypothetical protein
VPYTLDRSQLEALSGSDFVPRLRAGESLLAGFRTDRSAIKAVLPPPLRPDAEPTGFALVARYPETNFSAPYAEGGVWLRARHGRSPGAFCLALYVTDDMAMLYGRENLGLSLLWTLGDRDVAAQVVAAHDAPSSPPSGISSARPATPVGGRVGSRRCRWMGSCRRRSGIGPRGRMIRCCTPTC